MSGGPLAVAGRGRGRAWAELLRVSALFTVPGDALAGAAAAGVRPGRRTGLAVGASLCLYEAGMALNDWADREEDAAERPERPIPSGRIRPGAALAAAGGLTVAGLVLAACAGRRAAAVAGGLASTVWAYDLGLKHTKAGPAAMAAARSLDLLLGAVASSPTGIRPALPSALALGGHTYAVTAVSRRETQGGAPLTSLAALGGTLALAGLTGLTARRRTEPSSGPEAFAAELSAGPTGSAGAARAMLAGLAGAGLSALADAGPPSAGPADAAADRPGAPAGGRARVLGEAALAGLWGLTGPAAARPGPGDVLGLADAGLNTPRYAAAVCDVAGARPGSPAGMAAAQAAGAARLRRTDERGRAPRHGDGTGGAQAAGAGTRLRDVAGLALAGLGAASAVGRLGAAGLLAGGDRDRVVRVVAGVGLAGLYVGTAGRPLVHAVLNPSPPLTQRAVGGGIRAMIPLQAALAARAGAPGTALALVGLVPVARRLARKVNPT
ncbi:SCO3242 family prenyltransferase [Streptomyces sp. NPDC002054]|uniref:SCO3242 family prenyltransferase n=1 Tax=Streptomyces sp. NPDC002054 TaxID=3154663 RepID=UPI00332C89A2